jgi:hypothetical protein
MGSSALSMIQGCQAAPGPRLSAGFSVERDQRSTVFIESAEEPVNGAVSTEVFGAVHAISPTAERHDRRTGIRRLRQLGWAAMVMGTPDRP